MKRRLLAGVAVACILAVLVWLLIDRIGSGGDTGAPGVPTTMYGVPQRVTSQIGGAGNDLTGPVEPVEQVGPLSAVFVPGYAWAPVGVSADDGSYHLLDLGMGPLSVRMLHAWERGHWLALSPDGTRLASAWTDQTAGANGLLLVDLRQRTSRVIPLTGQITRLAWSPDGTRLAWFTREPTGGSSFGKESVGGMAVTDSDATTFQVARNDRLTTGAISSTPSGIVLGVTPRQVRVFGRSVGSSAAPLRPVLTGIGRTAAESPDGSRVAVGSDVNGASAVITLAIGKVTTLQLPKSLAGLGSGTRVLGWLDDDHVVLVIKPSYAPGRDAKPPAAQLALWDLRGTGLSSKFRVIGRVPYLYADTLTVATDLMTLETPTVERPAPDWP